jgi:hypothetical protein
VSQRNLRVLENTDLNILNIASFASLLCSAQKAVLDAGFQSSQDLEEFYDSLGAMSIAYRDLISLASCQLTNFTMIHRNFALSGSKCQKEEFCKKARRSSLSSEGIFGPEAEAAWDDAKKDPTVVMGEMVDIFRESNQKQQKSNFNAKYTFTSYNSYKRNRNRDRRDRHGRSSGRRRHNNNNNNKGKPSATTTSK